MMDPSFGDNLKAYLATLTREERVELIDPTTYAFNVTEFPNNPNGANMNKGQMPMSNSQIAAQGQKPGEQTMSKGYYVLEFTFFIIALLVYIGIYFVQLYVNNLVISHYYSNSYAVASAAAVGSTTVPQPSFTVINVIKSIVYVWAMWKFANAIAILDMLAHVVTWKKVVGFFSFFLLLCGIDCVLFILLNQYNLEIIFAGSAMLLALLISSLLHIGHEQKFHVTLRNAVLPFISYIFITAVYWIVMPQIYKLSLTYLSIPLGYSLFFYLFPIIDTLLVLFNWMMQHFVSQEMKLFVSTANNWLLQGYRTGVILRTNFTEIEFYYQIFFIVFRNIFFNYVVDKSKGNRMNVSMTGWIFAFYTSYVLQFVPICGVMNVITSGYYLTYVANLGPYLYSWNPFTTHYSSITGVNILFVGNITWWTPLIVWVACTFTQKYHLFAFNWKLLFYSLFGIFMFYEGLVSGLFVESLAVNAIF